MSDDGGERSHAPTQKRRDAARREGQILVSRDLGTFVAMAAVLLAVAGLRPLVPGAVAVWSRGLRIDPGADPAAMIDAALAQAGLALAAAGLAAALPVALAAVLAQAATGGLVWVTRNHGFRLDRIDPLAGLGRMASAQALIGLGQSFAKVALLGAMAGWHLWSSRATLAGLGNLPLADALALTVDLGLRLLGWLTLALAVLAAIDLAAQWRRQSRSLMMTLEEVRREAREDNGSPELKARQRRMQAEASRRRLREAASVAEVPQATAILRNPTRFAVAIRFVPGETAAPLVVAMGRDRTARRILDRGARLDIPTVECPGLTRAIYFTGSIGAPIPERLYTAAALVLAHVWRVERGLRERAPDPDLPEDMRFDAAGRRTGGRPGSRRA
ncbi:EscU/YscU/HrcU family type III secretion system export apparatus switch protein [Frigidibacter oleivorans]|uniref:EscU/YscU/HrcU family type III secretion system export apparatus switch protein n=1 Tax=Frigidibacter oleivorans TaxID=2487129 RepID=UPI000F8C4B57|nr:EscU/YscU/HrcU family type III secretion system export apparatus switch protein [Frigidibacter oleivorans]